MAPSSVIVAYTDMVFTVSSAITCLKKPICHGLSELDQRQNGLHVTGKILSWEGEVLICKYSIIRIPRSISALLTKVNGVNWFK